MAAHLLYVCIMTSRMPASARIICSAPVLACISAFGQQSPPPPVFPSTGVIADGGTGPDYPEPRPVPYQAQSDQGQQPQQGQPMPYPPPPPQGQAGPQQYPPQQF